MVTRIKICGLTRATDVEAALKLNVHALGFVFYPASPRYISPGQAQQLTRTLPPFVTSVGLFVNATEQDVTDVLSKSQISLLQFHGDETPEQCHLLAQKVQRPFIRALRIKPGMSSDDLVQYEHSYRKASPWFKALLMNLVEVERFSIGQLSQKNSRLGSF